LRAPGRGSLGHMPTACSPPWCKVGVPPGGSVTGMRGRELGCPTPWRRPISAWPSSDRGPLAPWPMRQTGPWQTVSGGSLTAMQPTTTSFVGGTDATTRYCPATPKTQLQSAATILLVCASVRRGLKVLRARILLRSRYRCLCLFLHSQCHTRGHQQ
jgi:hypothetical protein